MLISQSGREAARRLGWQFMEAANRRPPAVTSMLDRHNPVPEYRPDSRVDAAARTRLTELLASRQQGGNPQSDDMDVVFRSITSRDAVVRVDEPTIVEPRFGWAVLRRGVPLYQSHYAANLVRSRVGRQVFSTSPEPAAWAKAVTLRPPEVHVPVAISLLDWLAGNYVHFLDIIVNRVRLADEVGVPATIPLLVARSVAEKPFCRDFLAMNPGIHERVLVVDRTVRVDQLYLIRTAMDSKDSYDYTRSLVPTPPPVGSDRLFLTRSTAARGRGIENELEVREACEKFGFVAYDPAADSLAEQASRLARARFVLSTHGAGLANIMFRAGAKLDVLELFPPSTIRDHFFILSRHYDFGYSALVGKSPRVGSSLRDINEASFEIDLASLIEKLDYMTSGA